MNPGAAQIGSGLGPCCGGQGASGHEPPEDAEALARAWLASAEAPPTERVLGLLREEHPLYAGLNAPAVARIRGALLLCLGRRPLTEDGLDFVLEEFESAHDPYLTAAAARVLRTAGAPSADFAEPLAQGLLAIRNQDDLVRLDVYGGRGSEGEPTTATAELLAALRWLGPHGRPALESLRALREQRAGTEHAHALDDVLAGLASAPAPAPATGGCCCGSAAEEPRATPPTQRPLPASRPEAPAPTRDVLDVEFEDQDGNRVRFGDWFVGKPSIVVFFYTRCENPRKCPTTIAKLGELQRELLRRGLATSIRTAAITYDPAYDLAPRLEQYRRSFGAERAPDHRMLRTVGPFAKVRDHFALGVNYGAAVVNRHRLEAHVLDPSGRVVATVARRRWDLDALLARAQALLSAPSLAPLGPRIPPD